MRLEIVEANGGKSVYLNDERICGSKPWGGGTCTFAQDVDIDALQRLIDYEREDNGKDCNGDVYEMIGESRGLCVLKRGHRGGYSMAKRPMSVL